MDKIKRNNRLQEIKHKKKAEGICIDCQQLAISGQNLCANCNEKAHNRYKKKYEQNKLNNICVRCGKRPPEKNKHMCEECLNYIGNHFKNTRIKRKKTGLCAECGQPAIKNNLCEAHSKKRIIQIRQNKEKRKLRRSAGLCENCGNVNVLSRHIDKTIYCESCYLKTMSRKHFGTSFHWKDLKQLFEKNHICPYTGNNLKLGVNASLDHKIPKNAGGDNSLENLQFIYSDGDFDQNGFHGGFDVNIMKGTITDEKFRKVIKIMYDYIYNGLTENSEKIILE